MHDLSTETLLTRYTLRAVLREPISMGTMAAIGLGLGVAGAGVSAAGTIAGGNAQKQAGQMAARSALDGSEMIAVAQETGGALGAKYSRDSGEMAARSAEDSSEYSARSQEERAKLGAAAKRKGGEFAQQASEYQAVQSERAGQEALAVAQRKALDRRKQIKLTLSSLQARAAASGGGAGDVGVVSQAREIAQRGEYEALGEMYAGESVNAGYQDVAAGQRFTGAAQRYGANAEADAIEFEGTTGATAARMTGRNTAAAARYQGDALAAIREFEALTSARATRFSGQSKAEAAIYGGNAAQDASMWSAAGTILGGAGSAFTGYSKLFDPTRPRAAA